MKLYHDDADDGYVMDDANAICKQTTCMHIAWCSYNFVFPWINRLFYFLHGIDTHTKL